MYTYIYIFLTTAASPLNPKKQKKKLDRPILWKTKITRKKTKDFTLEEKKKKRVLILIYKSASDSNSLSLSVGRRRLSGSVYYYAQLNLSLLSGLNWSKTCYMVPLSVVISIDFVRSEREEEKKKKINKDTTA